MTYPANWRRWFNITFVYLAVWLPALLLLSRQRCHLVWQSIRSTHARVVIFFLIFHFLLVMYGGTNILVFVSYSLPVEILVLRILLESRGLLAWEPLLALFVVIMFNREWMALPLPEDGLDRYLNFYGGYYHLVTRRSLFRVAEALSYVAGFWLLRAAVTRWSARTL